MAKISSGVVKSNNQGSIKVSSAKKKKPVDVDTGSSRAPNPFLDAPSPNQTNATTGQAEFVAQPTINTSPVVASSSSSVVRPFADTPTREDLTPTQAAGNAVLNALSVGIRGKNTANTGSGVGDAALEFVANDPYTPASVAAAVFAPLVSTAASAASTVGKALPAATTSAGRVAANTASAAKTASWLTKAATSVKNPAIVIPALMGVIGSYPFAGFIKEEALQTLGFGVSTAVQNNDFVGAQAALDMQNEVLNPDLWNKIIAGVPYANVVNNLKSFYTAAKVKASIDQKVVADLQKKVESGISDEQFYADLAAQRAADKQAERDADAAYYAEVERQRAAAKAAERAADEKYWNDILSKREAVTKKKDTYSDDYWSQYYKTVTKASTYEPPSNLKFGLL